MQLFVYAVLDAFFLGFCALDFLRGTISHIGNHSNPLRAAIFCSSLASTA